MTDHSPIHILSFWIRKIPKSSFYSLLLCVVFCFPSLADSEEILKSNAIFKVFSYHQSPDYKVPFVKSSVFPSSGSGFVIEGNYLMTNAHVVSLTQFIEVKKENSDKRYIAQVRHINHSLDLAILEVNDPVFFEGVTPLKLGAVPSLDSVVNTFGFPLGGEKLSMTRGVVSRIEKVIYSHTGVDEHLAIQTDAAINPGNSGGPVLQDNKVVGVAFQGLTMGDNIGYLIPVTVISHFLNDIKDDIINGTPEMGVYFSYLTPNDRLGLKIPDSEKGVLITGFNLLSPVRDILKKNDLLTAIDDIPVSDDGNISYDGLSLAFYELIERKQMGDAVKLSYFREGSTQHVEFRLGPLYRPFDPARTYKIDPDYFFFAGLIFQPISGDYIQSYGKDWWSDVPYIYRSLYQYQDFIMADSRRIHFVTLTKIFPIPAYAELENYTGQLVESVNGVWVDSMETLRESVIQSADDYIQIKFYGNSIPLLLNKSNAFQIDQALKKQFPK